MGARIWGSGVPDAAVRDDDTRAVDGGGAALLRIAQRQGRSVAIEQYTRAPLLVSPPLVGPAADGLSLALLTTGGGLLGNEQLTMQIALEPGTQLTLRTIGALRLLPSSGACASELAARLCSGSLLTYLPEPLIPCSGASYRQRTLIELEGGATVAIGEVITPGRLARGERFAYRRLDLGLRIRRDGRPLLLERILLEPAAGLLPHLLGSATHLGSLVIAGPRADHGLVQQARELLATADERRGRQTHAEPRAEGPGAAQHVWRGRLGGATRPAPGLVVIRALAGSAHELQGLFSALVRQVARAG